MSVPQLLSSGRLAAFLPLRCRAQMCSTGWVALPVTIMRPSEPTASTDTGPTDSSEKTPCTTAVGCDGIKQRRE
jgi:hypothetical protein